MPTPSLATYTDEALRQAIGLGYCRPPLCGGSLNPWAPLIVPPKLTGRTLDILLPALVALDVDYLREHPDTPPLYRSGIRYQPEPPGQEQWLTIPWCLVRRDMGQGCDCEDLAAWRAAELLLRGERAQAIWSARTSQGPDGKARTVYHIRVRRASGKIEDPSAALGMPVPFREHHSITDGERT